MCMSKEKHENEVRWEKFSGSSSDCQVAVCGEERNSSVQVDVLSVQDGLSAGLVNVLTSQEESEWTQVKTWEAYTWRIHMADLA